MKSTLLAVATLIALSTSSFGKECSKRHVGAACHALKIVEDACSSFFDMTEKQWIIDNCSIPDVAAHITEAERDMGDLAVQIRRIVKVLASTPVSERVKFCKVHLDATRRNFKIPVVIGAKTCSR